MRDKDETWKPSSDEKMALARMGVGLRTVPFNNDGNSQHVHDTVMKEFPVLESCGGYTLLRLGDNSHTMVEIDGPDGGISVHFLKGILNQAKLYIRPLQKDITDELMKPHLTAEVSYIIEVHFVFHLSITL